MKYLMIVLVLLSVQCQTLQNSRRTASSQTGVLDSSGYFYDPTDRSCDGFPRLAVQTMPGTCLGMVLPRDRALDKATDRGFIKPRTIVQIPNSKDFLVVDMGGWKANNGRLFLLSQNPSGIYGIKLLKFALDNPHGLRLGPDGFFYIGEKTQISRFKFVKGALEGWQLVVGNLARKEGYMHPLSQFVFDPRNGDLLVNAGSPSDHCFASGTGAYRFCPESENEAGGAVFRLRGKDLQNIPAKGVQFFEVSAKGLRNSMAMVVSPTGLLIQGENSRDFPELEEPYEEINIVDLNGGTGKHYGWPYCYNFRATSPEFYSKDFNPLIDCNQQVLAGVGEYQAPYVLMPPHVSPLHMDYYKGSMFADLFGGKLLVTWHGYQPTGHRLVAYDVDAQGRPALQPKGSVAQFQFDSSKGCPVSKKFEPRGGLEQHAAYTEIISGWNAIKNLRPKGAPVAFTEADDGSLWIVEDRENRVILRLARSNTANHQDACETSAQSASDPAIEQLAWRRQILSRADLEADYRLIQKELIQKNCLGCHGNMESTDVAKDRFSNLDFLFKNDWITPGQVEKTKLYGAIARLDGYTPMPPIDKPQFFGTAEGERLKQLVARWVKALPTEDITNTYSSWTIEIKRNVRNKPGTDTTVCGQLQPGDRIYGDRRPASRIKTGTIQWTPVYILPQHSRLGKGLCAPPEDGVYWIAD